MSEKDIAGPTMNIRWAGAEVEAVIISEMEKLRSSLVEKVKDTVIKGIGEELLNEMRLTASLMREKRLGDGSFRVSYLISDIVEKAGVIHRQIEINDHHNGEMTSLRRMLVETNERLREWGETVSQDDHAVGDIVGFEEDVEALLHEINNQKQRHFIACLHGVTGSGKTTLARELFMNADDIVHEFDSRVWVSCREILSEKELLINIIQQVAADSVDPAVAVGMERAHLLRMLIQQVQEKRCFIVLDDIRGQCTFNYVINSLPKKAKRGSTLLLTSRAIIKSSKIHYHHGMKPLDPDKSWQLLQKTMLLSNTKLPKKVERRGKTMLAKHSGGLPLAVKEVAMEWLEKGRLGIGWEEVVESEDLKLTATLEAIESSVYQNLEPHSKLFFLHLGLFKLGTTLRERRLVQTWIASGALGVLGQEDDYEACVDDFIERNIIESLTDDAMTSFHVGAIFHKLAIRKINDGIEGASHRVVYCSREKFSCSTNQNERLICVSFNGGGCLDASPSYWKSFEQLRVLEFENFGLKFLPEAVCELIELRYLGLRNNYIQELPISLSCLKNLEVLDIALNFMVKVPDIIWEMDALVHLYMSDIFCMKPLKIEALKNLQTLTYISVDHWEYKVSGLRMMTSLWKLGIEKMDESSGVSMLFASLAALESLESLVLRGSRFRSMPSLDELGVLHHLNELKLEGLITNLPCPENFPPQLYYLTLVNSCVDEDPMPILEKLPELLSLELQNAYTGSQMMISKGGFPKLNHLCIGEFWHLRTLQVARGALSWLNKLEITSCPYLHSLPKRMMTRKNLELNIVATKNIATKTNKVGLINAGSNLNGRRRIFVVGEAVQE